MDRHSVAAEHLLEAQQGMDEEALECVRHADAVARSVVSSAKRARTSAPLSTPGKALAPLPGEPTPTAPTPEAMVIPLESCAVPSRRPQRWFPAKRAARPVPFPDLSLEDS